MQIDLDKFYEDYLAFKAAVEPHLPALAAMAQKSKFVFPAVAPSREQAGALLQQGDLEAAGAALGIHRATKQSGHAFDEPDDSFQRRLAAELFGAQAAGAEMAQPAASLLAEPVESAADAPAPSTAESITAADEKIADIRQAAVEHGIDPNAVAGHAGVNANAPPVGPGNETI
jgi:hypothetical protein